MDHDGINIHPPHPNTFEWTRVQTSIVRFFQKESWGSVGQGCGDLSDDRGGLNDGTFTVDDGVESVDGVGSVVDGAVGAIGFNETVRSLDDVSTAGLVLGLVVSGHGVGDAVGIGVLGVGVVVVGGGDDGLSDGGGVSMGSIGGGGVSMGSIGRGGVS
ncbi:hypothetical protein J437_LFUL005695 [Ladona fulva]|uniref:Uncharacterized protein n=1 Tax=Ladona fulva TaxID=123851 RepID=A0A8K0K7A3_LADFU|nr:hypothetical protein J437_LFUL005695 [Ladona fulva]